MFIKYDYKEAEKLNDLAVVCLSGERSRNQTWIRKNRLSENINF